MIKPQTRLLFTDKGKPVKGLHVKAEGSGQALETDENGQVEVPLTEGRQKIQILRDGEWTPQLVDASRESSLIIVDLAKRSSGELPAIKPDTSFLDIGKLNLGDRYVYDEVLGRGGMSVVLKARDRLLNREVAVKLLSQELQSQPEAQNIFLTEARNLATLSHPNLVAVHDICKVEEQVFIVIEYVDGESLEKLIDAVKGFNETVALQTSIQLARVVGYLHDHGVIHRDLKPANAMIRNDGTLKLIDFGLARHFDELYIKGTRVRGTPAYMSPEQIRGNSLTPACDVYQLGVCLFEILTGQIPFTKGDMGYAHVHEEPPRVDDVNPEVSPDLADLVARCLRKDPKQRPKDGHELLRDLQALYQMRGVKDGNLLEELRRDIHEKGGVPRRGPRTSQVRMMEDAGRHHDTSEFDGKDISQILSDPNLRSQIVIHQAGNRWAPILAGAALAAIIAVGAVYLLMGGQQNQQPQPSGAAGASEGAAIVTTTPTASDNSEPTTDEAAVEPAETEPIEEPDALAEPTEPKAAPEPEPAPRPEVTARPAPKPAPVAKPKPRPTEKPAAQKTEEKAVAERSEKSSDDEKKASPFAPKKSEKESKFLQGGEKSGSGFLKEGEKKKSGGFL